MIKHLRELVLTILLSIPFLLVLLAGEAFGLICGKPISCGLSMTARKANKDMIIETAPNTIKVTRQDVRVTKAAAINGEKPPEILAEALSKLQKVPNWSGENQWRRTLAQLGQPTPWAKPLQNHKSENMNTESVDNPKAIVARPEKRRPEPNRSLEDSLSDNMPPTNLDIAYAMFCDDIIRPDVRKGILKQL